MNSKERVQYITAVASFVAAVVFGLLGIILSTEHDPAGSILILVSQLLLLTASIFGIDYKFNK